MRIHVFTSIIHVFYKIWKYFTKYIYTYLSDFYDKTVGSILVCDIYNKEYTLYILM